MRRDCNGKLTEWIEGQYLEVVVEIGILFHKTLWGVIHCNGKLTEWIEGQYLKVMVEVGLSRVKSDIR